MSERTDPGAEAAASRRFRLGHPAALLVLVFSLALVIGIWRDARQRELQLAETQFRARVGRIANLVAERLDNYELTLKGGASLVSAVQWPAPAHWRSYAAGMDLAHRFPAVIGLGFAAYADPGRLSSLQLLMRDAGSGRFEVRPHGRRAHYGPIVLLEPHTPENLLAIGYDMYAEPTRQAAMKAAMDSGQSRLTAPVRLVQDGAQPIAGLLMYTPVYQGQEPQSTPARRTAMKGWVYLPFRVVPMIRSVTASVRGSEKMRIVDVTALRQVVVYEEAGIEGGDAFAYSLPMDLHGRRWRFDFYSGPVATAAPNLARLDWLLLAGIAVALLLFATTWVLASTESRARRLANAMTASYRRSEERFRSAMQYSAIGKALLDTEGRIVESNPSFAGIVGRQSGELVGLPLADLLDDAAADGIGTSQQLQAIDEAGGVVRGTRTLHRRDGEQRQVQLTFAPVPGDPGRDIARLVQVEDVTERVRAEREVLSLNRTLEARVAARTRELREANRELESFAYSVSHDLRAPLRSIEGFSRILGERHAGQLDANGLDYLQRVRNATGRMASLIDALLKLSRVGRGSLTRERVDLSAMASEVAAALAEQAEHAPEVRIAPGLRVEGDRALLRTLLENLLGNAFKFTRGTPGARVQFSSARDASGRVAYVVRDNGAGFDQAYADKLFQPFQRLHSQEAFAGHGIGLASVKRIVERHGGNIRAEGRPGQGATFVFTLGDAFEDAPDAG
ncbi:MAG TPA: CHASE domain-containing protein [Thermomonas sp.]|nr:CHASE domain-containing protein [Thermomonas sp.]